MKNQKKWNVMVTILLMLVLSGAVRSVERFSLSELIFDKEGDNFGIVIGLEISITWTLLLCAEFLLAIKYF